MWCDVLTILVPTKPLDLTLLDKHFGDLKTWQRAIEEIHLRNMSVLMDNTMATYVQLLF